MDMIVDGVCNLLVLPGYIRNSLLYERITEMNNDSISPNMW